MKPTPGVKPRDRRSILMMAAVMSLSSADGGAIGALAGPLEHSLHFGNARLGLLVAVSSLVGAAGCLPMGMLVDRANRKRLLVATIVLWSVAMASMAMAGSYTTLVLSRVALGLVTSAAGPIVASLTGDLFPAGRRASVYGLVLTGEILGSGVGLLASAAVQSVADWRVAFLSLAVASLALALVVQLRLQEPARTSGTPYACRHTRSLRRALCGRKPLEPQTAPQAATAAPRIGPWQTARQVLAVPTNRVLIASSALGYFFLGGLRTFAVVFTRGQYGLGQAMASVLIVIVGAGTLVGTVAGGRVADRLARRGRADGRMLVAGGALTAAAALFLPGLLSRSLLVSLPFYVAGATLLAAPNAPLDAARLDVVPPWLWGRAEAVRTVARTLLEGSAPLAFGLVSAALTPGPGGGQAALHALGAGPRLAAASQRGLALTFTVMLVPLAIGGLLLLAGRRHYLADVSKARADGVRVSGPEIGEAPARAPGQPPPSSRAGSFAGVTET